MATTNRFDLLSESDDAEDPSQLIAVQQKEAEPKKSLAGTTHGHEGIVDRISGLPDCLILQILSFLPMKDVVKTSLLSKQWQSKWTCVDTLTFICNEIRNKKGRRDFLTSLNNTLIKIKSSRLRKLLISCDVRGVTDYVHEWIRFATIKKVENLELNFETDPFGRLPIIYHMPSKLYSNSSLQSLKISHCRIDPSRLIHWNSLKTLVIKEINVTGITMENVLSGCSALQVMELRKLYGDHLNLIINSKSLRKMEVDVFWPKDKKNTICSMQINTPNLEELRIKKIPILDVIGDFRSLVNASLNFDFSMGCPDIEIQKLVSFLQRVQHVTKLELGIDCLEALSIAQLKGIQLPTLECKHLALVSYITRFELPGILWILRTAFDLEALVVKMQGYPPRNANYNTTFMDAGNVRSYLSKPTDMKNLSRLKNVKIIDLSGLFWISKRRGDLSDEKSFVLEFVQFILQYGTSLEEFNLDYGMATKLSSFARSSPNANITLS